MEPGAYAIGQAVFIRTDTLDFEEKTIPFTSLEELVELCSRPREGLTLEKIIVHCLCDNDPTAVTLGFISATKGQKAGGQSQSQAASHAPGNGLPY